MKLLKDERGLAGVAEAGLIGLLLVVIVFAGTRVYNSTRQADQANQEAVKISQTSPDFSQASQLEEEKPAEEDKPKEEEKKEDKTEATDDKPKPEATEETTKKKQISLSLTAIQNGENVTLNASLGAKYDGQCDFKLKKDTVKLTKSTTVNGVSTCSAVFDKDKIDDDGNWLAYVYFRDNDKTIEGWADKTVNVTL